MADSSLPVPLQNIYASYEWLSEHVDNALRTRLGNTHQLSEARNLCLRLSATVEQASCQPLPQMY